ncbi:MAG: rsbT antagonist protein RsbS [Patiriisocius sp.]|jgi:rsbT antagonist protein RsbS
MDHSNEVSKVAMYETQGCWVILVQQELTRESAQEFQRNVLDKIHLKSVKGVVIDLSGINVIDSQLWSVFSKTAQMIKIMGVPSVITGLSPGVVASIIDHDLNINEVATALNLEEALSILNQSDELAPEDDIQDNEENDLLEDTSENDLNNDEFIRD